MGYTNTVVANNFQMSLIASAMNTAFESASMPLEAKFIAAEDTSYTAGNGAVEFWTTGESPVKIASLTHSAQYSYLPQIFGEAWTKGSAAQGVAATVNGPVRVVIVGRTVALYVGYNTGAKKYTGGFTFAYSKNGVIVPILHSFSIGSSGSEYPQSMNTIFTTCEYDDAQGYYGTSATLFGTLAQNFGEYYKGNFMYPLPICSKTQEPNYFEDVFACGVSQFSLDATYADVEGTRYFFIGSFAIKDTE